MLSRPQRYLDIETQFVISDKLVSSATTLAFPPPPPTRCPTSDRAHLRRVPHLRDSFIVAKVGHFRGSENSRRSLKNKFKKGGKFSKPKNMHLTAT